MSSFRFVIIVSLILAACSVAACAVLVYNNAQPTAAAIPAGIALIALAALAFGFWSIQSILQKVTSSLKQQIPERLIPNDYSLLKPFVKTIINYAENINERIKFLKSQNDEFELQLQLLGRQKQNTEAIIYSIRDAVIVTDASDRIIIANNAAEGLFGFHVNDSILKPLNEIIKHEQFVKLMVHSRQSELAHVKHEITFEGNDNIITFGCIISCVKDDKGHISGVVAVLHDMTKEKEISQMKNDFVSHVSHELKTPLASINAYAEMLVDGEAEDTETINQFCSIIQTQAQRLNRLIEDILNISRIESGLTKVTKDNLSLAIIIADAAEMIKSYAHEKNITVDTQTPIIFDQVYADKDMITQVIINLLSNAVKYTSKGGNVSVQSVVDDAEGLVRVTVTDTGVGIPPDDVDHVFDKFFRVEANKKYAKGTGLGLNLVKQIVEKVHDGRVFVTSVMNQGSTFGFELPLAAAKTVQKT